MFKSTSLTPPIGATIRRLAALEPPLLAVMHGSCFAGNGADELNQLADFYEAQFRAAAA